MIRKAEIKDLSILAELACQLWPDHTVEEMCAEFAEILAKPDAAFFLAYAEETAVGFAQCQLRYDYVEGTDSSPVGYLEGIYVTEEYRKQGVARELLTACESWAKAKGCSEFASDCELDNVQSLQFHLNVGFEEANRIICFTKKL
uniref:Aminoglycoside N(6')-acetyltransferase type 1 n=1 Tax=uncultured bacterium DCM003Kan03 TaxID=1471925 RepID=X2KVH3_9BACT|nr:N-acetyltransferase GCN5 [uncultured bacterium DCM003Kan03]